MSACVYKVLNLENTEVWRGLAGWGVMLMDQQKGHEMAPTGCGPILDVVVGKSGC